VFSNGILLSGRTPRILQLLSRVHPQTRHTIVNQFITIKTDQSNQTSLMPRVLCKINVHYGNSLCNATPCT